MKNMVCLISDQHVPNLLTVHAVRPDMLFLIETPEMKNRRAAINFLDALTIGGFKGDAETKELKEENSIEAMEKLLEDLVSKHPGDEWIANVTGGTKPMAIGAYKFFKGKGSVLYVALKDQGKALDFSGAGPVVLNHPISINEFLVGYGFRIQNIEELNENKNRAEKYFKLAALLAANYTKRPISAFLAGIFRISRDNYGQEEGIILDEADDLFIEDDIIHEEVLKRFSLKSKGDWVTGKIDPQDVKFLTGGWLEVFIWGLLHKFEPDLIHDLFPQLELQNIAKRVSNECDVVFMKDMSLFIVECKTGQGNYGNRDEDDILYKIEAIRKQPGALLVRSYLATTRQRELTPNGDIKGVIKERCSLYNCTPISGKDIQRLAEMELNNDSRLKEEIASVFKLVSGVKK
jgi:hypothetical protein